jgi:uncharacterized protein (DUF58 family)
MSVLAWLQLLVFFFLGGVLFQLPWLVYFSAAVTLVIAIANLWRNQALNGIRYTRRFHYTRGFPGEKSEVQLTVVNDKLLPISWLRASDTWPVSAGPEDTEVLAPSYVPDIGFLVNLYSLRWRERITRAFPLRFRKRGVYEVGPLILEAGDLFGLYEQRQELHQPDLLVVFPEILPFAQLGLPTDDPFGDRRTQRPLFDDPTQTMGIRPYQSEDGFRRIHWPATARSGSLQVKVYQPVTARVMVLCLDVTTEEHYWLGYSPEILEHMLKVCATLAYQGIQDGYAVGLFANGCLAHSDQPFRILPGRSPDQLAVLLQALAGVIPFVTARFEIFLLHSMTEIPFGATLVLVTARVSEALQDTLLRLRRYRQHITLLTLQKEPPPALPGIHILHLPFIAPDERMPR